MPSEDWKVARTRVPDELAARLADHEERIRREVGATVSRSDLVRGLLVRGLDALDAERGVGRG